MQGGNWLEVYNVERKYRTEEISSTILTFSPFQMILYLLLLTPLSHSSLPSLKKKTGILPNLTKTPRPLSSMQMQFSTQTTHSVFNELQKQSVNAHRREKRKIAMKENTNREMWGRVKMSIVSPEFK